MKVSSRILSMIMAMVLALGLMPMPAFAVEESVSGDSTNLELNDDVMSQEGSEEGVSLEGEEAPDDSTALAAIEEESGSVIIDGAESSAVSYVFIEHPKLGMDETQRIAIGLVDEGLIVDEASLALVSSGTNDRIEVPLSCSVAGALLFELSSGSLATGSYELSSLEIDGTLPIDFDEMGEGYSFIVAKDAEDFSSSAGQEPVEGVETDALVMDADGEIVSADDLSGALDEAAEGSSGGAMALSANSRSATKVPSASSPLVVVLDPGHGGYDGGAGGYGVQENIINLKIAQYCREELEKYLFVNVYMTREDDTYVALGDRVDFAVNHGADLVLSLHNNSSTSSAPHGSEVIIPNESTWYYDETHVAGEELAEKVLDQLTSLGLSISQGIYWRDCTNDERYGDDSLSDYYTLIAGPRESGILGIIIEHAFVSNPGDAAFLASEENLKALGVADAQAVVEQYGLRLKTPMFGFSDVYEETPHYQEIGWLSASGISTGYSDGTFRPLDNVTRQDMAAFLYRLAGSPSYTPTASEMDRFSDVDESTPHYKEILWMASTGISTGFDDGMFHPGSNVARQDAAAFLRRLTALYFDSSVSSWEPTASEKKAFSDVSSSTPHAEDIWWLASAGISGGFDDGTFRGESTVARQDMAAFLYRLNNLSDFEPTDADKKSFTDVDESTSHSNEIWWLASEGISTGYPDDTFRPLASVARQDMAAFLYRLAGSPSYTPTESEMDRFSDVDENTSHYKEILWLASTKITTGFPDGTFRPGASVAREDMAAFMRRAYDYLTNDASSDWKAAASLKEHFTDVNESTSHSDDIWWLASMGISLGFHDGSYGVGASVARADMAAFLFRLDTSIDREAARTIPIMGETQAAVDQFVEYFESSGSVYPSDVYGDKGAQTIEDFVRIVIEESEDEGVRAEVVFCQAMKETGWLKFGGDAEPDQCNFAGLGATGGGAGGAVFEDVRTGIRAQVQHLKAYASTEPLANDCVDPRFDLVTRGSAPYLTGLNGKWAVPGTTYGQDIAAMIERLYEF